MKRVICTFFLFFPKLLSATTDCIQATSVWVGAVTYESVDIRFQLPETQPSQNYKDILSVYAKTEGKDVKFATPEIDSLDVGQTGSHYVSVHAGGLQENTSYSVFFSLRGVCSDQRLASFRTFPKPGTPFSFNFGVSSCSKNHTESAKTYEAIASFNPLFFMVTGDLFYADIPENKVALYHPEYASALQPSAQKLFFSSRPVYYIFDDHDFGANNANMLVIQRPAALQAFAKFYPHPALHILSNGEHTGFQAFTVGRCRIIITDLRSQATGNIGPDSTTLGTEQRDMLFRELADFEKYKLVFWVNSKVWNSRHDKIENWGWYPAEREKIANFISLQKIYNLVVIGGDAHMSAIDDGENTDYSTQGDHGAGFLTIHASPLYNEGSVKGTKFNKGCHAKTNPTQYSKQFAIIDIVDNESKTCLMVKTYDVTNHTQDQNFGDEFVTIRYEKCVDPQNPTVRNARESTKAAMQQPDTGMCA